jgi:hypothetical protein
MLFSFDSFDYLAILFFSPNLISFNPRTVYGAFFGAGGTGAWTFCSMFFG